MSKQINIYEILRRPLITEKNTTLLEQNKYIFEVAPRANKPQVKEAIEKSFKVSVVSVNIMNVAGKMHRFGKGKGVSPEWKKAVITLKQGDKIQLFEGV
ncbi:MAG: 50S ribosomal protein L23 [Chloroflexi bacterium]|nr:50S ribosomal protein L23 [Chloroflexota bacterium]